MPDTHIINTLLEKHHRNLRYAHPRNVRKATVIAIIYHRHKIISYGFNRRTMSRDIVRHTNQIQATWTIHAEDAALRKAGMRAKGSDMIVVRIMKDGEFGNAKPCYNCEILIRKYGIARVTNT